MCYVGASPAGRFLSIYYYMGYCVRAAGYSFGYRGNKCIYHQQSKVVKTLARWHFILFREGKRKIEGKKDV